MNVLAKTMFLSITSLALFAYRSAMAGNLEIYSFTLYYIGDIRASEYNMLPTYCRNLVVSAPPGYPRYVETEYDKAMLRGIGGKHHFCNISVLRQRIFTERTPSRRTHLLQRIVNEAEYVVRDTKPDAPLRIKAHLEKAWALTRLNQIYAADREYQTVLQYGSRDPAVYLESSDFYERFKNKKMAIEILAAGIKRSSAPSLLQKKYLELGGPLPVPEPLQKETHKDSASTIEPGPDNTAGVKDGAENGSGTAPASGK